MPGGVAAVLHRGHFVSMTQLQPKRQNYSRKSFWQQPPNMGQLERREYPRKKIKAQIVFRVIGAAEEDYKTYPSHNLSAKGVFLKTADSYPLGTEVELRFALANSPQLLRVRGRVKWFKQPSQATTLEPGGIAVEFVNLSSQDQKIICDFLESNL